METRWPKAVTMLGGAVLALALVVTTAEARGRGKMGSRDGWGHDGGRGQRLLASLDLSDEQTAALQALREERRQTKQALHAQAQQAFEDLRALAQRADATVEEVEAIEARLDDVHRQMRTERRAFRMQAYELLTAEQKARVPTAWRLGIGPGPGMGKGGRHGFGHGGRGMGPGMGPAGCGCAGQPPVAPPPDEE